MLRTRVSVLEENEDVILSCLWLHCGFHKVPTDVARTPSGCVDCIDGYFFHVYSTPLT